MALHDEATHELLTTGTAESLPDAATVVGLMHDLTNTGNAPVTWSVAAGLGFTIDGVNSATITIAPGQTLTVQAQASGRWVVAPSQGGRRVYAGSGVTDASGNLTLNFTTPFPGVPVIAATVVNAASNEFFDLRVTAVTANSVTLNLKATTAINVALLGLTILATPAAVSGRTIHVLAAMPGQGV